jgi:hypothetical protein
MSGMLKDTRDHHVVTTRTRRVEKLAASLGVTGLSKSQVSVMAAELDELAGSFRNRPLDHGPYTFAWIDALTRKAREGGRTVNVHCLIATGVSADGCREILGTDVTSFGDGAGWLAFLRGLVARGLSGVALPSACSWWPSARQVHFHFLSCSIAISARMCAARELADHAVRYTTGRRHQISWVRAWPGSSPGTPSPSSWLARPSAPRIPQTGDGDCRHL